MSEDMRSQRMPTAEGRGKARAAWEAYAHGVNRVASPVVNPVVEPVAKRIGASMASDLFGFWLCWQLEGGFAGLERMGMGRTTIFRKVKRFRQVTGLHPDEYEMPGVTIDVAAYLAGSEKNRAAAEEARRQRKK